MEDIMNNKIIISNHEIQKRIIKLRKNKLLFTHINYIYPYKYPYKYIF